ncbi:Late endosomal/lysosomal adaptor and MAPK and MTOR activator domain containing protein [Elaphomyces granulatus]
MGICSSCLGLGRRDDYEPESSRLLDDDLYQSGYGYGSLNHSHLNQPDPEDQRREREALDAICQRASDSVIDIWAVQPQPLLQPRAALPPVASASQSHTETPADNLPTQLDGHTDRPVASSVNSRGAPTTRHNQKPVFVAPKHWGEVIISTRKGRKQQVAGCDAGNEFFAVLEVI